MNGATVIIQPASARRESLFVALLCAAILCVAVSVIALRGQTDSARELAAWQIDARTDLTPAEQGVLADLTIAAGEIDWMMEADALPQVADLVDDGIPPFAPQASDSLRGDHRWRLHGDAYLGQPALPDLAGSLLLIPGDTPAIWLAPGVADAPADLSQQALADAGWRLIVSHYDASVTRHGAHKDAP